ncbi:MAG: DUF6443 domain-containing protein [Bacteroidota bacterium]
MQLTRIPQSNGSFIVKNKRTVSILYLAIILIFFAHSISAQSINITNPTRGTEWLEGNTYAITWTKSFSDNVKIEIWDDDDNYVVKTVIGSVGGTSYTYTLPYDFHSPDYILKISRVSSPSTNDDVDIEVRNVERHISLNGNLAFGNVSDVQLPTTRTLTISNTTSSNSTLTVYSITYPAGFSGNWSGTIAYGQSQNVTVTFDPTTAGSHSGTLVVNSNKSSGTNTHSISGTATTSISLVSPNELVTWKQGTNHTITWSKSPLFSGNVKVELLNDNYSFNQTIVSNSSGTSFNWTVPGGLNGDYVIRVTSLSNGEYDQQDVELLEVQRIITLGGNLSFGAVSDLSLPATRTLTIYNSNQSTESLNISSIDYPTGFSGNWSGSVAPGQSQNVTVTFDPTTAESHSGTITVNSDKTSGTDTRSVSGEITPDIAITSPLDHAVLTEGQIVPVTWNKGIGTNNVRVEIFNDSDQLQEVLSSSTSANSINWKLQIYNSPDLELRVTSLADPTVFDVIDIETLRYLSRPFEVDFGLSLPEDLPASKTLYLINNTNSTEEVLAVDFPAPFSGNWSGGLISPQSTQQVNIEFDPLNAANYQRQIILYTTTFPSGVLIPIKGIYKTWDMWLQSPNGGEIFDSEEDLIITLDHQIHNPTSLTIELYKNNVLVHSQISTTERFVALSNLTLQDAGDYKVHVFDTNDPTKEDWSDHTFTIDDENLNYIITKAARVPIQNDLGSAVAGQVNQTIVFYDGLGRPMEEVVWHGGTSSHDIITPITYDGAGRQTRQYLPLPLQNNNGFFQPINDALTAQSGYYTSLYGTNDGDHAYAETQFEASPLNRPLKQGAPGVAWQPDANPAIMTDNVVHYGYNLNTLSDKVYLWAIDISTDAFKASGYYPANQLTKTVTTDEEGHAVIGYVNKHGQTVLKRVQAVEIPNLVSYTLGEWADTYYVYDSYGDLRYTLPPEAINEIGTPSTWPYVPSPTLLNDWAFQYKYDGRRRLIEKKVPGAQSIIMIYDDRNRLVLTQDGEQRNNNKWHFTKYDQLNRPIITGEKEIHTPEATLRDLLDGPDWHQNYAAYETLNGSIFGYTSNSLPKNITTDEIYTITYYGNYAFPHASSYPLVLELGHTYLYDQVKGLVTGTMTKVLDGSNTWLEGVTYYDDRYRPIQSHSQNLLGEVDRVTHRYDFMGQVKETKTTHENGTELTAIQRQFDYDHNGRLLATWHQVNDEESVLLAQNEYNELGQLIEKNLHQVSPAGGGAGVGQFAQSVDYGYNIRGWLTSINNAQLANTVENNDIGQAIDYWGMEIGYNNILSGVTASPIFNGNISAVKWSDNLGMGGTTNIKERAYAYTYDPMNRIKTADHSHYTSTWSTNNYFQLSGLSYDLNGNIESLTRKDESGGNMDILGYSYSGNQLLAVSDAGNDKGFKDGTNVGDDYLYDDNGNMIRDENKDIATITYNHLNLPTRVEKDANNYILYTYNAAGIKLRQEVYEGGSLTKTTDYVGEFIYENNELTLIHHEEGRIVPALDAGPRTYEYQYRLKDHLDNTRLTFTTQPDTLDFLATMESENSVDEETLFSRIPETRATYSNANHTSDGNEAARLNQTQPVGPALSLPVGAGDEVNLEVYAYYEGGSGYNNTISLAAMVAAVAGAFGGVNGGTEAQQAVYNGFDGAIGTVGGTSSSNVPAAYLNYAFFDENLVSYQTGFKQISGVANLNHERISFDGEVLQASKPGFMYVWVSNNSATTHWVYFDDLKVTLTEHPVIQTDDYYPFGLLMAGGYQRITAKENRFLLTGNEKLPEWGVGMYDFNARMYDAGIGRFMAVDPKADDEQKSWNPYHYTYNNPTRYTDPTGLKTKGDCEGDVNCLDDVEKEEERKAEMYAGIIEKKGKNKPGSGRLTGPLEIDLNSLSGMAALSGVGIRTRTPKGNTSASSGGFGNGFIDGFGAGFESTVDFFKSLGTKDGWQSLGQGIWSMSLVNPDYWKGLSQTPEALANDINKIPTLTAYDWGYGIGFGSEKTLELILTRKAMPISKLNRGIPILGKNASAYTTRFSLDLNGKLGRMSIRRRTPLNGWNIKTIDRGTYLNRNFFIPTGRLSGIGQFQYLQSNK